MEHKNIVATIYLKNGQAVKGMDNFDQWLGRDQSGTSL